MDRNTPEGPGPVHVPLGNIVANEKWRGSQLVLEMQGKIKLVFEDGLTLADFYLSSRSCIVYITEADLVAGNGYRKRLVRVRNSGNLQGIVVVEKTQISEQYFAAVQKFTVLDLGMVLLPVANQMEASCLIAQLRPKEGTRSPGVEVVDRCEQPDVDHGSRANQRAQQEPFPQEKRSVLSEPSLVRTVQQIPGVGKVKAPLLLQKFPTIQKLSNASIQELEAVVGHTVAQQIHAFFTKPR